MSEQDVNMPEYTSGLATIDRILNMSHTIHSARSLYRSIITF